MKSKEGLIELWKNGFFEQFRTTGEISKQLLKDYGATTANLAAVLNTCKDFLRKDRKGWIQRARYDRRTNKGQGSRNDFDMSTLHPQIYRVSNRLFLDGHYPQAVFEAFKEIEILVRKKSRHSAIGKNLMMTAFSEDRPILKIKYSSKNSEKEEQEGFKFIFAGAMLAVKDPKSHGRITQNDPNRAFEYLKFASLLARVISEARKQT